jgi:hypothetical protein
MEKNGLFGLLVSFLLFLLICCSTVTEHNAAGDSKNYQASQEEYDTAYKETYRFIETIQETMDTGNFSAWKKLLTAEYIQKHSDPRYLKRISNEPGLKNNHIVLHNLHDYFVYVFIPSRSGIKMDRIEFITQDRVKVITIVNNTDYVIYLLQREENHLWKIGVW